MMRSWRRILPPQAQRRLQAASLRYVPLFERLEPRQLLSATPFPLQNAGFEQPDLSPASGFSASVPGWQTFGAVGVTHEAPLAEASPAPEGEQYLSGDSDNWVVRQAGPTIAANTRYILSLDLFGLSSGTNRVEISFQDSSFANLGSTVYQPVWDADRRDFDLASGEWTTVKLGINSAFLDPAAVGRQLSVVIGGSRVAVDNVALTVDDSVHDFYISSSSGAVGNSGFSADSPWEGFGELAYYGPLMPGERILLKAGDTFHEELNIRGKGTPDNLVELGRYGEGDNPVIRRQDVTSDVGVIWNNASHARISGIDVEHSKIGVYLRYEFTDFGSTNVLIEDSNFRDMPDPTLNPEDHNFEFAWSDAIWVGGQAWQDAEQATRLDGLTIRNVTATNTAHLFGTGWYFPTPFKSRLTNLVIEDSVAYNNLAGAFQLFGVDGGRISRVHSIGGGGQDTWSGTTLGFVQDSRNVLIEDSEFSLIDRAQAADGSGMDYEGNTENMTFRNNVIHSNAGSGLLILGTGGPNLNLIIEGNTFYNNAVDPWNSEINSEVQGSTDNHTGIIRNNTFYRRDSSVNFLSPGANWSGFEISGNQELEYSEVRNRPTWWDFETPGDLEGWGGFNQWAAPGVEGGSLVGQSTGDDAFVQSPPTWVSTNTTSYAWVRMSQTAGTFGQLFYTTATDPVWNAEKSLFFPITPDGQMHDYFIDFGSLPTTTGVITQIRLDPTIATGSEMAIDFVRLTDSTSLDQTPTTQPLSDPVQATFVSIASEDGYVRESGQDSGVGGLVSSGASTFRLGDDALNRAYRKFLSFDTSSLPDNAIVTAATIGITRVGDPVGSVPIGVPNSAFGDLIVDVATPGFGASSLAASDWQSGATGLAVSEFAYPAYADGMTIYSRLDEPNNELVNRIGRTQFRVRYANDDDGDATADYMSYATSNHPDASARPTLTIEYYVPTDTPGDYNQDAVADQADAFFFRSSFGGTYGAALLADGNGDRVVNAADYVVWRDNLASVPAPPAAALASTEVAEEPTGPAVGGTAPGALNAALAALTPNSDPQTLITDTATETAEPPLEEDLLLLLAVDLVEDRNACKRDPEPGDAAQTFEEAETVAPTDLEEGFSVRL